MIPWYTWLVAALPIGGGILWYVLGQLRKAQVESINRANAEGYIKSDNARDNANTNTASKVDEALHEETVDLGRW